MVKREMQIYSFRSLNCMHLLKKWVIHQVIPVNNRSIMLFDTLSETCTAPEKASIMDETGLLYRVWIHLLKNIIEEITNSFYIRSFISHELYLDAL